MTSELSFNTVDLEPKKIEIEQVQIEKDHYYKISNYNAMRPFFMSIVSDSNHWMFISSNGGLSAGRKDSENALFPYYTDDKITESAEITGSKSIFRVLKDGQSQIWEPFSIRNEGKYKVFRNLYKNIYGNKLIFEEINENFGLTFRYQWNSSSKFGFVRKSTLINNNEAEIEVTILDGIQNIVPYSVGSAVQNQSSNLVDAYKRNELEESTGLGIFALSAIIVDKAEPSEALKANIAWSVGLPNAKNLLSSLQLDNFRKNIPLREETDIKAEKGAYFISSEIVLPAETHKEWMIIADVNQNQSAIAKISHLIKNESEIILIIENDIETGTSRLIELVGAADGVQLSADHFRDTRHFSNALFNIMRGGIFDNNYQIEKWDFRNYLSQANKDVYDTQAHSLTDLPEVFSLNKLKEFSSQVDDANFKRLCLEYMPLKFSRRHGDPSRPWNRFSINTRSEIDGSKILDYEGNWRDIFQNWEALAYSYPDFVESMIHKFLNASTFDGYNPYRITKGGIDWEAIEPDDPWSYIGYWGDHQIIYLLKFLEIIENYNPGKLESYLDKEIFVYANVPYRIKSYENILKNPKDTIEFNEEEDRRIREEMLTQGADAALLRDNKGSLLNVNFTEKILATVLAKISNLIPEGGIWMNTQRPEWNDANNALVGNGVSMVTLYYLRRFFKFLESLLSNSALEEIQISSELAKFYQSVCDTLKNNQHSLNSTISNNIRKSILDELGQAGSNYRHHVYEKSFGGSKSNISFEGLRQFIGLSLKYLEHSIRSNKREDNLYHAYNLMTVENEKEVSISHLSEMLEGQVAVLSSGYLSSKEAVDVLNSLKKSALFREDQYSYLLYPNKDLPRFLKKNIIPDEQVQSSALLTQLTSDDNTQIIEKDINNICHFNGNFKNAIDLNQALDDMMTTSYAPLVVKDKVAVLHIFEEVFNHKAFTGRSGTFFGYEGLGSIYWHMVSKLQLAVLECCLKAIEEGESEEVIGRLLEHYYEINEGIGVHKPPSLYGAFPTDPYSHTPAGKGAQQPGMTGQVKEDILSRFGELGIILKNGSLSFNPCMLRKDEFLTEPQNFKYVDVHSAHKQIQLEESSLCFTYCQIPVIYKMSESLGVIVKLINNTSLNFDSLSLDKHISKKVFDRTGEIEKIIVQLEKSHLR